MAVSSKDYGVPKNPLYVHLGRNLVKIRTKQKWTQSEAAERIGVSFRFYQDMEAGISAPSLPTLVKLVRGMKTDFARVLEGCDTLPECDDAHAVAATSTARAASTARPGAPSRAGR